MKTKKPARILLATVCIFLGFVAPGTNSFAAPPRTPQSTSSGAGGGAGAGGAATGNASTAPDTSEYRKKEAEAIAAVDPETAADIRRLLVVTNAQQTVAQVFDSQLPAIKENMLKNMSTDDPDSQALVDKFIKRMQDRVDSGELVELIVPVYAKHFSHEDIKKMIAFFDSPTGKRYIQESPAYLQEVQAVTAQHWQEVVVPELLQEMAPQFQELNIHRQ
jgi:uncharacterized protein